MTDFALYAIRRGPHGSILDKFDTDLNFLAEYNVAPDYCSCPAGPRPSCRHRKMLPRMLGKVGLPEFYCYETNTWHRPLPAELETDLSDKKTVVIDEASAVTQEMWDSVLNSEFKPLAACGGTQGEAKARVEPIAPTPTGIRRR